MVGAHTIAWDPAFTVVTPPKKRELPDHVQAVLRQQVDTLEKLEVLLFLRSRAGEMVAFDDLARDLRSGSNELGEVLAALTAQGLVTPSERGYAYGPVLPPAAAAIDALAAAFEEDRLLVMRFLNRHSLVRIRGSAVRAFADAFRSRPDGDDGDT